MLEAHYGVRQIDSFDCDAYAHTVCCLNMCITLYGVMCSFLSLHMCTYAQDRDSMVLGKLVHTLAVVLQCTANAPCEATMSGAYFE